MYGFVTEAESAILRKCLLEISAAGPKLYSENEKHLLIRCRDSCKGSGCGNAICKSHTYFTQHESNVIYAIHCRIPREKEPETIPQGDIKSPTVIEPERKGKQWMS